MLGLRGKSRHRVGNLKKRGWMIHLPIPFVKSLGIDSSSDGIMSITGGTSLSQYRTRW